MAKKSPNKSHEEMKDADSYEKACVQAFRDAGFRLTKQRTAVIRCLAGTDLPLTARELHKQVDECGELSSADQVSIYRILETMLEMQLIHQVFPSGGYVPCFHQHCNAQLHVLIRCTACEQIEELDVPQDTLRPIVDFLKSRLGFQADEHMFQMNGLCRNCARL